MQNMYVVMHNESQSRPTCGELSEMPKNITLYQIIENVNFLLPMKYIIIVKMCVCGGGGILKHRLKIYTQNYTYLSKACVIVLCAYTLCLGERCIHFSDSVIKVNRKGRTQERWLMITGKYIHAVCIPIKGCVLIPEIVTRI